MRKIKTIALAVLVFFALTVLLPAAALAANDTTASKMKLTKTKGDVNVEESDGKKIDAFKNMRLYDGYNLGTRQMSYAWIKLDNDKLIKMDAQSDIDIKQNGKKLEVLLNSGNLFFDIAKPLEKDESLSIRTSSMAITIRGTFGWVDVKNPNNISVSVIEGSVSVIIRDTGYSQLNAATITAGETVDLSFNSAAQGAEKLQVSRSRLKNADIPGFVLVDVAADKELIQSVYEVTDGNVDLRGLTVAQAEEILAADQGLMDSVILTAPLPFFEQPPVMPTVQPSAEPAAQPTPTPQPSQSQNISGNNALPFLSAATPASSASVQPNQSTAPTPTPTESAPVMNLNGEWRDTDNYLGMVINGINGVNYDPWWRGEDRAFAFKIYPSDNGYYSDDVVFWKWWADKMVVQFVTPNQIKVTYYNAEDVYGDVNASLTKVFNRVS